MGSRIRSKTWKHQLKWDQKSIRNPTKVDENSIKNPSKIYQKIMKMRSMGASWDDFGGIWAHVGWKWWVLAPFWSDFFHFFAPRWLQDGILGRFGLQVGVQNRPKSIPRAIWNVINFLMDLKIDFWSDLVPSWLPNPSKNEAKLAPKSMQVGVLIWELLCDGFWMDFYWFFAPTWHGRNS